MEIIEMFSEGKDDFFSGDVIVSNEKFITIMDINTSKAISSESSANKAIEYIAAIIKTINNIAYDSKESNFFQLINNAIFEIYSKKGIEKFMKMNALNRFSAAMITYSNFRKEIWSIGDCQCKFKNKKFSKVKNIDCLLATIRSLFIETELLSGKSVDDILNNDTGREFIYPLLCRQYIYQDIANSPFSYRLIDGFKIGDQDIDKLTVMGNTLIMASDGYPMLFNTLAKTEEYLLRVLNEDPLLIKKHKSTKGFYPNNNSFDDRAYVKIKL